MADYEIAGRMRTRSGSVLEGVAPSNVYPTADGADIILAANADAVFRRLCAAMERPQLAESEDYATHGARGRNMAALDAEIAAWTSRYGTRQLLDILAANGVPAGEIFTAANMLSDEHYAARDMVVRRTNKSGVSVPMTGIVPKFSRTPGDVHHVGPRLGEHTALVLFEVAGIDATEQAIMTAAGVIAVAD